jgi:hypothetical protein
MDKRLAADLQILDEAGLDRCLGGVGTGVVSRLFTFSTAATRKGLRAPTFETARRVLHRAVDQALAVHSGHPQADRLLNRANRLDDWDLFRSRF